MKKKITFLIILINFFFINCNNPEENDTTPPRVIITYPLNGGNVNKIVIIKANATDNEAIQFVEFYIDGDAIDTLYNSPYHYSWNTTVYPDSTNHTILVRATDTNNNKSDSDIITVIVNNAGFEPPPVTIMNYEVQGNYISLYWSQSEIADFYSYGIYKSINSSNYQLVNQITDVQLTSFVDTVAQTNNYSYYISVQDQSGLSSNSQSISIQSSYFYPTPVFLSINIDQINESINLNWTKNLDTDFSNYKLFRSLNTGVNSNNNLIFESNNNSDTIFIDSNVQETIEYFYNLYVSDSANLMIESNEVSGIMKQNPEPVLLQINSIDENYVELSWSQSNDILFSHYTIYRSTNPGININSQAIDSIFSITELSYIDSSCISGTTYYYSIAVFDEVNNYSFSNEEHVNVPLITRYFVPSEYPTITDAINAADNGDTVIVEEGTYYENLSINKNIVLGSLYLLDNYDSHIDNTIISGAGVNTPITIANTNNFNLIGLTVAEGNINSAIHVNSKTLIDKCKVINNLGNGIKISYTNANFYISNSEISNNNDNGIYLSSDNISLNVEHCKIYENQYGIYQSGPNNCNLNITDSEFYNNSNAIGVVGNSSGDSLSISDCSFHDNTNVLYLEGPGYADIENTLIFNNNNSVVGNWESILGFDNGIECTISDCNINNNTTRRIIYSENSTLEIIRTKFYNNSSSGSISIFDANLILSNCIFYDNYASQYLLYAVSVENTVIYNNNGGGIFSYGYTTLLNSIIWSNSMPINFPSGNVMYSDIQEVISGTGNINTDPLFSDSLFHLSPNSPCIDAGNPATEYNDIDGTRNDMGAYGGPNGNW